MFNFKQTKNDVNSLELKHKSKLSKLINGKQYKNFKDFIYANCISYQSHTIVFKEIVSFVFLLPHSRPPQLEIEKQSFEFFFEN